MRIDICNPPRRFTVGLNDVTLEHVADIRLEPDELVTFHTPSGTQYDVTRKSWGYYATPSLNSRLPQHGLDPVLVRSNASGKAFLLFIEQGQRALFEAYSQREGLSPIPFLQHPGQDP